MQLFQEKKFIEIDIKEALNMQAEEKKLFDTVCQLAREVNEKELRKLINEGFCLDVLIGEYTPITLLAEEGNSESVNFLIEKFNSNINMAVLGYAMGKHVGEVNWLLSQGASLSLAIRGYARKGHYAYNFSQGGGRFAALEGYAQGGFQKEANSLLDQGADPKIISRLRERKPDISFSYPFNECMQATIRERFGPRFLLKISRIEDNFQQCAVRAYARGGHVKEVNLLLANARLDESQEMWMKRAALEGYAKGSYCQQVNALIDQDMHMYLVDAAETYAIHGDIQLYQQIAYSLDADIAVEKFAVGGHTFLVNFLLDRGANPFAAIKGYAEGGHINQVNYFLAQKMGSVSHALAGYLDYLGPLPASFTEDGEDSLLVGSVEILDWRRGILRLMAFTSDMELRRSLAGEAKKQNPSLDINLLFTQASKWNQLITENKLTYSQARSYLKISANNFLFQGQELVRRHALPSEIYFKILSCMAGSSEKDAQKIFYTANERLKNNIIKKPPVKTGFFSFFNQFKSTATLENERNEYEKGVEERWQARIKL